MSPEYGTNAVRFSLAVYPQILEIEKLDCVNDTTGKITEDLFALLDKNYIRLHRSVF